MGKRVPSTSLKLKLQVKFNYVGQRTCFLLAERPVAPRGPGYQPVLSGSKRRTSGAAPPKAALSRHHGI